MDVFELLLDLIGLLFLLIGKFWTVILVILGYALFGKNRKRTKGSRPQARPVLTPVFTPSADRGGTFAPAQTYSRVEPQEEGGNHPFTPSMEVVAERSEAEVVVRQTQAVEHPQLAQETHKQVRELDPREAMKWSIIFSPPRAKQPYSPARRQ